MTEATAHVGLPAPKDRDSNTTHAGYVSDMPLQEANMLVPASVTADLRGKCIPLP
jgi:hypothetical protein